MELIRVFSLFGPVSSDGSQRKKAACILRTARKVEPEKRVQDGVNWRIESPLEVETLLLIETLFERGPVCSFLKMQFSVVFGGK